MANGNDNPAKPSSPLYGLNGMPSMQNQQDIAQLNARLTRVEGVTPYLIGGGGFATSKYSPLLSEGVVDGHINLTTSDSIDFVGAMAPSVVDGAFTVAKPTDSSAVIYWDGTNSSRVLILRRADGTSVTIPPSNITITGLTHDAVYKAYAYWAPNNQCGIGWSAGNSGTPLIAFDSTATNSQISQAIAAQHQAGREPLGSMQWTQPASGGSGGGSPPTPPAPPDPGTCVKLGSHIEPLGFHLPEHWRTHNYRQAEWIFLETESGRNLSCTPNHPLYDAEKGKQRADRFKAGQWIITSSGEEKLKDVHPYLRSCTKVQVDMDHGHLFFANGFLSHNFKLNLE